MLLYLDMCSLQRPLDELSQLRVRLEAEAIVAILALCNSKQASLVSSDALEFESRKNSDPVRKNHAEAILTNALTMIRLSPALEKRAARLHQDGLSPLT